MAVERQFIVKLLADPKGIIADFQKVRGEAEKTFGISNAKLQELLPGFKILTTAAAGVFGGLVAGAGLAVKAAAENQAEQHRLAQILNTTGKATRDQIKDLNAQADALEAVGVVAGGNVTVLQSQLATFDLQADTIQKLTPAIVDYVLAEKGATATSEDFKSMTNGLAQALNGQFGALTRAGFVLDENTKSLISNGTESERAAAIVDVLSSTYGGFNEALRNTTEGQLLAFRNSINKLQTDLGTALLPVFSKVAEALASFAGFAARNSTVVGVLALAAGVLSAGILALAATLKVAAFRARLLEVEILKNSVAFKAANTAAMSLGKGLAGLMIAEALAPVFNSLTGATSRADKAFVNANASLTLFAAGTETAEDVLKNFIDVAQKDLQKFSPAAALKDALTFQGFGRDFKLLTNDIALDIEVVDRTFKKFADSSPEAAQKVIDALKAQLAVTDPSTRSFQDLTDAIARYEGQLLVTRLAQGGLNEELRETQSLQEVVFGVQLKATLSKYDDLRANNANADSLKKFQREVYGLTEATKGGTSATEKLAQAKAKLKSSTDAVGSAQITNRNAGERLESAEKSLTKATTDAIAARDKLRIAMKGYGTDSKEAAAASRTLAGAQRDLQRSQRGVETALRNVAEAEKRLAELRNKAADPNEVMNAEFGLEKSKLDVEEATLAVADAEDALAKTLADPEASPRDKRKAELALVAAKFALRDSIISAGEAEREVIATRATGATAEELAEAERALEDAKLSVADALDSQTTALERLNEQQENYRKVTEGINEQDKEFLELSAEIVKADEDQATAAIGVRDAREAATKATDELRQAEEELRKSRKELRLAGGKPPGRAFGGPVMGARPYVVGERGPELFVPNSSGTIVPNSRLGGGGGGVVINVSVGGGVVNGAAVGQEIAEYLRDFTRVNGPLGDFVSV
jgi:hypothetical protein